jgi:predicted ester cyclase
MNEGRNIVSEEQNKQTFRRVIEEGFNQGNLSALDELFAANFREHQDGMLPPNLEGVKGAIRSLRSFFPDLKLTIEEIIAVGDKTWARIVARGTHGGQFMQLPPTGKTITITVIDICRFEGGKIFEHWGVADRLAMMQQIGAIPSPERPPR